MSCSSCGVSTNITTVSITPRKRKSVKVVAMEDSISFSLPFPAYCAISTVLPMVRPVIKDSSSWVICDPSDTAEICASPLYHPTTSRSTVPYSTCIRFAARKGRANHSRTEYKLPCSKSIFFCMDTLLISFHKLTIKIKALPVFLRHTYRGILLCLYLPISPTQNPHRQPLHTGHHS